MENYVPVPPAHKRRSVIRNLKHDQIVEHDEFYRGEPVKVYFDNNMKHPGCEECRLGICVQKVIRGLKWRAPIVIHCSHKELN